jgi:predicted phage terminase large subunit-like protein
MDEAFIVRPQPGPQERFLASSADIAVYGGAAGGGKTYAALIEPLRYCGNGEFGAVFFRRESTQITNEGGLWDTAASLYPLTGARPVKSPKLGFTWPSGARVTFGHLNRETNVYDWQGAQIPLIIFDELTHFSRGQFLYMLSRNRSTCGVRPYIRATTNPDADSWVAEFIAWWIDPDTGYPIPERAGVLRWFVVVDDRMVWADTPEGCERAAGVEARYAKSVTFVPAKVTDNRALLAKDPDYLANLKALSRVERERLLEGNWKIRPAAGLVFPRHCAAIVPALPGDVVAWVRAWDLAATPPTPDNPSPNATAGVKMGKRANGRYVIADVRHMRVAAHEVRTAVRNTAAGDGRGVRICVPEDPGQAGKEQALSYVAMLAGYSVYRRRPSKDKITRSEPFAAQWQAENVDVVAGPWTDAFLGELEGFPDIEHDDQVDAAADAFIALTKGYEGPLTHQVAAL